MRNSVSSGSFNRFLVINSTAATDYTYVRSYWKKGAAVSCDGVKIYNFITTQSSRGTSDFNSASTVRH